MKAIFVFVLGIFATTVFSQATDSWPPHLPIEYQHEVILIHTLIRPPEVPPSDYRRWSASLGEIAIREHEVYSIIGMAEEFRKARQYRRTTVSLLSISSVTFFMGGLLTLYNDVSGSDSLIIGPTIMVGSVITFIIGLFRAGKRWSTFSEINTAVADYNLQQTAYFRDNQSTK